MFVKNIYIRITTNAFITVLGIFVFMLIIKVYGIEVVGTITFYVSLAGIFSLFADLGVSTAYNKFLASEDNSRDIVTYLFLKTFLIAVYILVFSLAYFFKFRSAEIDNKFLFIAFAIIVLDLIAQFFTSTFMGKRNFLTLSVIEIVSSIAMCGYNIIACFVIVNKYFLAANLGVFHLVTIISGMAYFRHHKLLKLGKPEWSDIKRYINYCLPIALSSVTGRFATYIDKLLLGKLIGMRELGLYQIAFRCYSGVDKLIKPVTTTMFTEIVHRITNTPSFFHKKFRDIVQILNVSGGVLALALIFLSTPIISLVFGPENIRSAFILKLFALIILAKLFWRPYAQVILSIEKHRLILYLEPLNLLLMMVCYYFLIPLRIGDLQLGAAALPLTEFIIWTLPGGVLRIWILKREYGNIHMLETVLKIWLPLIILIVIGYLLEYPLFVFPIAILAFFIIGYYLNVLTKDRWNNLIKPFRVSQ